MKRTAVSLLLALVCTAGAAFAEGAVVEAVQYPAWLERGGAAVPLTPGTTLRASDELRTGSNARVQIKMGEGSTVKLGENAKFIIDRTDDRGIFRAALSVLSGAFRFTTDALRKSRHRDITIKVKNVTAGIRGTDLWGKSTDERDLVCLLEGKISVGSEGHPNVTLDQPLDFYQRPRGGDPSVAKVDEKQIEIWARETEISAEGAAGRVGGDWRVTAAAFPSRNDALAMNRRVRANGYPSEVVAREGAFLVQIVGLSSESAARALMANLRTIPGIAMPVIQPR